MIAPNTIRTIRVAIQLTQCCTQFKHLGIKVLWVLHFNDNETQSTRNNRRATEIKCYF